MRIFILACVLGSAAAWTGCRTPGPDPRAFLASADAGWTKWLDEPVSIHQRDMPLWQLRALDAFRDGNYYLDGHTAGGVMVNLDFENVSRRAILWEIQRQTGLRVDFFPLRGVTVLRFRSERIARLKGD